jgi:hypothetical protein
MWKLTDLNEEKKGRESLFHEFESYVLEKGLNFIVAREKCVNQKLTDLGIDTVRSYLTSFAACDFSMIALFDGSPKAPFIAANMEISKGLARVQYLIDFNQEATTGKAGPFYSKLLGAFATHFFSARPEIDQLWFPFFIEDMVGSKMGVRSDDLGTAILREPNKQQPPVGN